MVEHPLPPARTPLLDQPVNVKDLFGVRVEMGPNQMKAMLGEPSTQRYLLLVYCLLLLTDPPGLHGEMSLATMLGIWAIVVAVFHGMIWLELVLAAAAQRRGMITGLYRTALFLPALLATVLSGELITSLAAPSWEPPKPFLIDAAIYWVIAEAFGIMYFTLIIGDNRANTDARATGLRQILIGPEPVALETLRLIEAREHHVFVTLDDATITQRARLSDIVAQTRTEDGFQPHRSWWVAARAARGLERDGQKHHVVLVDGTRVPVARTRLSEVRNWLDRHG